MKNSKPKTIDLDPCLGIPVTFDPALKTISDSRGLWRWKRIFVGPSFRSFPPREQAAMLLHEVGHCKLRHLERRIFAALYLIFWPPALARYCQRQEFQADLFAAHCGYGADLAHAFMRLRSVAGGPLHPPTEERISRLLS
jgi:Zn-dependent protease with chaperone function